MVYTECAETAAVPCGTSHDSVVSIHLFGGHSKTALLRKKKRKKKKIKEKNLATHVESLVSAVSLLDSGK